MRRKLRESDIKMANELGHEVFMAELYNGSQLRFWCPHCCKYHGHGQPGAEPYVLYKRVAHCTIKSRHDKQYYLFIVDKSHKPPEFC